MIRDPIKKTEKNKDFLCQICGNDKLTENRRCSNCGTEEWKAVLPTIHKGIRQIRRFNENTKKDKS